MNVKEEQYFHNQQILPRKIHSFHSHQRLIHIYIYIYINAQAHIYNIIINIKT